MVLGAEPGAPLSRAAGRQRGGVEGVDRRGVVRQERDVDGRARLALVEAEILAALGADADHLSPVGVSAPHPERRSAASSKALLASRSSSRTLNVKWSMNGARTAPNLTGKGHDGGIRPGPVFSRESSVWAGIPRESGPLRPSIPPTRRGARPTRGG